MDQNTMEGGKVCKCVHHRVVPWMVILIGVVVFFAGGGFINMMWEQILIGFLLIIIGGTKLNHHKCTCCDHDKPMKM